MLTRLSWSARCGPLSLTFNRSTPWWARKHVSVRDGSFLVKLDESADLRAAHDIVHARLRADADAVSINPAADGDGFTAHVTVTARGRARQGDEIDLDTVLLAEVGPGGDRSLAMPSPHSRPGQQPTSNDSSGSQSTEVCPRASIARLRGLIRCPAS